MIKNRRTFFVFAIVEPLKLGIMPKINTWTVIKSRNTFSMFASED